MCLRCGFYVVVVSFVILLCVERLDGLNHKTVPSHKSLKITGDKVKLDPGLATDLKKTFNTFKRKDHISQDVNKDSKIAVRLEVGDDKTLVRSHSGEKRTKEGRKSNVVSETTDENAKRQYIYGVPQGFPSSSLMSRHFVAFSKPGPHTGTCAHHVCFHGGVCVRTRHGFYCDCADQYIGAHCEFKRACMANPCKNAGTCTETGQGDFTCTCAVGSKGKTCELRDTCFPSPCNNDATCTDLEDGDYHCTCKLGYKGDRCQKKALCYPNPCKNGATCIDRDDHQFKCSCALGFKGTLCEIFSECKSKPCANGGTCIEMAIGYRCTCLKGFVGKNCEANLCKPNPCANDGKCSVLGDRYNCHCPRHYIGKHCEVLNACRTNPCLNGGACVVSQSSSGYANDGFSCKCPRGYYGNMCQMK